MDDLKNEIVSNIRACLISNNGSSTVKQLIGDYKMIIGSNINYRELGFRALDDFLRSVDSLIVRTSADGVTTVEARPNASSRHVVELIAKQRPSKPKKKPHQPAKRYHAARTGWRPRTTVRTPHQPRRPHPDPDLRRHRQYVVRAEAPRPEARPEARVRMEEVARRVATVHENNTVIKSNNGTNGDGVVGNNNKGEGPPRDLREVLNERKEAEKKPHSERTNRARIMGSTSSGSEDEVVRKRIEELDLTKDPVEHLLAFAKVHNLETPTFKVVPRSCRHSRKVLYDCKLQVGDTSYISYPREFDAERDARAAVARDALEDARRRHARRASLLVSADADVLARAPELVRRHYHGVWSWQVEADYEDLYGEALPLNWLEVVDRSPVVQVECVADWGTVLRSCKPEDSFQKGKAIAMRNVAAAASDRGGSGDWHPNALAEVSVPTNTVDFGQDDLATAAVTHVASAREVWCRQLGTAEADAFDAAAARMNDEYEDRRRRQKDGGLQRPATVYVGGYYAAPADGYWYRVRVLGPASDQSKGDAFDCFFIDYGDWLPIPAEDLYRLERKYAQRQAQAFLCSLAGLEDLYEASVNSKCLQELVNRVVLMETESFEYDCHDPTEAISVILYDSETNEAINDKLHSEIMLESAVPTLNKSGITEVRVTYTTDDGDIYVTVLSQALEKLTALLDELGPNLGKHEGEVITEATAANRLFLVKSESGTYRRVRFIDFAPNGKYAQALFVDSGAWIIVRLNDPSGGARPVACDAVSDVLGRYPEQAVRVRLALDLPTAATTASDTPFGPGPDRGAVARKVRELVPVGADVLLKACGTAGADGTPAVRLFKRVDANLVSLNDSIAEFAEFEEAATGSEAGVNGRAAKENLKERLATLRKIDNAKNLPSTGYLSKPSIPAIKKYFDVKIPMAVNPWNFFVQPLETIDKLNTLMEDMQETYRDVMYSPLRIEDVEPGRIYASKHDDGKWYRTSVMKVIHASSISVFYCDFGYYANLGLQQLVPLEPDFLELPYQAIKAKLHGIAPKQSKWTMEDCKYFQKLVTKKSLVSVIMAVETDEYYQSDNVLVLRLINTSTAEDVYIDLKLIEKGIAVKTGN